MLSKVMKNSYHPKPENNANIQYIPSSYMSCQRDACPTSLTLKVLVTTIDAQWEGMGDVGSARYEPVLLPPCPTIRVLSYSN